MICVSQNSTRCGSCKKGQTDTPEDASGAKIISQRELLHEPYGWKIPAEIAKIYARLVTRNASSG